MSFDKCIYPSNQYPIQGLDIYITPEQSLLPLLTRSSSPTENHCEKSTFENFFVYEYLVMLILFWFVGDKNIQMADNR